MPSRAGKHPWYKPKGYLHFDRSLPLRQAEEYVTDPDNILRHRFSPLIRYTKLSRRVKRDKGAEAEFKAAGRQGRAPKLLVDRKGRNIFYASHVDGYIYAYYAMHLQRAYEAFLHRQNIENNAIAYRGIEKGGKRFCNIHFADEVFNFISEQPACKVLCFDVSKFFDRLSTEILKQNWCKVLGVMRLPADHFRVFKNVTKFRYVEEGHIIQRFKGRFSINPRLHGLRDSGGSRRHRICDYKEMRAAHNDFKNKRRRFLKPKSDVGITGIAQGSALSGLLSNIFMIEFDLIMRRFAESVGGLYCRYSDDILLVVPDEVDFDSTSSFVRDKLAQCCGASIQLNDKKTEEKVFTRNAEGRGCITDRSGKLSRVQYLGFHFDGQQRTIRNSSISKDRWKILHTIRLFKKGRGKIDVRSVRKSRSLRIITPYDRLKAKGFIYYASRSAEVHKSEAIVRQARKDDRFVSRAVSRERSR